MKPAEILRDIKKLPKKLLGQNFLVDESVVRDMISAAEIQPEDTVVEVGPGLGALTDELAKSAKLVLAIEMDQELVHYLRLKKRRNVKIIRTVKPGSFYPRPKTDSVIIELTPLPENRANKIYWPAVEAGFRHKRQTLCNAINKDLKLTKSEIINILDSSGLNPLIRAQNLSFEEWEIVSQRIEKLVKKS